MSEDTMIDDGDDDQSGLFTQEDMNDDDNKSIIAGDGQAPIATSESKEIPPSNTANDDDDDGSSVGSEYSSDSSSSIESNSSSNSEASLTLMQRQARNIARNERFLGSLREKYKAQLESPKLLRKKRESSKRSIDDSKESKGKDGASWSDDDDDDSSGDGELVEESLGMVMPGTHRLFKVSLPIAPAAPTAANAAANTSTKTDNATTTPKKKKIDKPIDTPPSKKKERIVAELRRELLGDTTAPSNEENSAENSTTMEGKQINESSQPSQANDHHDSLVAVTKALHEKYPHREDQIQRLYAILSATISLTATVASSLSLSTSSASFVYIPPPIFCIGSKGTGKTSVICDIVGLLSQRKRQPFTKNEPTKQQRSPDARVQPAYVDCSIVEPSTVERLVYMIYKQLKPSSSLAFTEDLPTASTSKKLRPPKKRKRNNPPQPEKAAPTESSTITNALDQQDKDDQPRVLPSRRAKKDAIHKSLAQNATTYENVRKNRAKSGGTNNESLFDNNDDDDDDDDDSDDEAVDTLHSAVLSLGRSLQRHYGSYLDDNGTFRNRNFRKKPRCGILVLDKAEELLSLSGASKKGTGSSGGGANNVLSELLLLPKIMKLNLTIIVVTNYCTLHMTRLNNAANPSKALGTISNGVHPIILQFPAYKGNKMFSKILSTPENQKLAVGDSLMSHSSSIMRPSLKKKLVRSFWNTVVQFASDSTRDIRDFQRLGRALWPSFIAPLHPSVLRTTLETASAKVSVSLTRTVLSDPRRYGELEDEVVRLMGNKFYSRVSTLASGDDSLTLLTLSEDGVIPVTLPAPFHTRSQTIPPDPDTTSGTAVHNPDLGVTRFVSQPYLRSCLLLAAFVCQHNKADQDRKLFSVHGNGRRKKSRAKEDLYGGNDEDLAFGSTKVTLQSGKARTGQTPHQVEQLRSLKLRSVPLERVFSIFVTLVRLNPNRGNGDEENDAEEALEATMDDLGTSRLYSDLSHLIDLGYLQLIKGNQPTHLAPSRILCSLAREEALEISDQIRIPLERYLL